MHGLLWVSAEWGVECVIKGRNVLGGTAEGPADSTLDLCGLVGPFSKGLSNLSVSVGHGKGSFPLSYICVWWPLAIVPSMSRDVACAAPG